MLSAGDAETARHQVCQNLVDGVFVHQPLVDRSRFHSNGGPAALVPLDLVPQFFLFVGEVVIRDALLHELDRYGDRLWRNQHSIGDGRGRTAATLGGAVIGAAVGNELSKSDSRRDRRPRYEQVERCRTAYEERFDERVAGYRVTYEYNGRRQVTQLAYDPGRYLRVAVDVHPLG